MNRISVLDSLLISKIAAGEVVQGVYSVVKELVENSLDSGADQISVLLVGGGLQSIVVKDNGSGIYPPDLSLAVERFASSKVQNLDSLLHLQTYGFRGEALSSIAAVSRFKIVSNCQQPSADYLIVEGGKIIENGQTARVQGTTVEVHDLFYNVPARRKFLKTPFGEKLRAKKVFDNLALINLSVGFRWEEPHKVILSLDKNQTLNKRVSRILGAKTAEKLINFDVQHPHLRLWGVLGSPEIASRRPFNLITVNQRPVQDKAVTTAVRKGFGKLLQDRYPVFILNIELPPEQVDVNVHPSKQEIKFSAPSHIFSSIVKTVDSTLKQQVSEVIRLPPQFISKSSYAESKSHLLSDQKKWRDNEFDFKIQSSPKSSSISTHELSIPEAGSLWQVHHSYIVSETKDGILIIDQHAAAERILYENILYNVEHVSQALLFPVAVTLSEEEWEIVNQTKADKLYKLGFRVKIFSKSIMVEAVPMGLENTSSDEIEVLIKDLLKTDDDQNFYIRSVSMMACKGSVKAGEKLTLSEMEKLLGSLFLCRQPHICPHGRPTLITITLDEIARRIGRK
ncbi:MAG: hypothetical protein APR63_12505 [Desulfuromonas sp. SDB]|nr:MAG: hypothetical protein APR63_12505 [Desulfuromonas sp. SDB]